MKENQRIRLTKRLLQDSLISLMKTKSIYKISIKEICELAEVNRSTFYKHYKTEFDLLTDIENKYMGMVENYIKVMEKGNLLEELLKYVIDNIDVFKLFLNVSPGNTFYEQFVKRCLRILGTQVPKKEYQGKDQLEYLNLFVIHGALAIIKQWITKEDRETPKQMNDILLHYVGQFMET